MRTSVRVAAGADGLGRPGSDGTSEAAATGGGGTATIVGEGAGDGLATGASAAGWRYRRLESQLRSADGTQAINALVFGADLGDRIALVAGVGELAGRCFLDHWGPYFHRLAFAGHPVRPDGLRDALLGTWRTTSITTYDVMQWTFAPGGPWELDGAALSTISGTGARSTTRRRARAITRSTALPGTC